MVWRLVVMVVEGASAEKRGKQKKTNPATKPKPATAAGAANEKKTHDQNVKKTAITGLLT